MAERENGKGEHRDDQLLRWGRAILIGGLIGLAVCLTLLLGISAVVSAGKLGQDYHQFLAQLMEITPTAANVEMYADIVARAARRRELKTALEDGLAALADQAPEDEVLTQLDAAMTASSQRLESELLAPKEQVDGFLDYRAQIDEGSTPYVRTGIKALDKLLGGGMVSQQLQRVQPGPAALLRLAFVDENAGQPGVEIFRLPQVVHRQQPLVHGAVHGFQRRLLVVQIAQGGAPEPLLQRVCPPGVFLPVHAIASFVWRFIH